MDIRSPLKRVFKARAHNNKTPTPTKDTTKKSPVLLATRKSGNLYSPESSIFKSKKKMYAEISLLKAHIQKAESLKKEAQAANYTIEWEYNSMKEQFDRDQTKLKKQNDKLNNRNKSLEEENISLAEQIETAMEELVKAKQFYWKNMVTNQVA